MMNIILRIIQLMIFEIVCHLYSLTVSLLYVYLSFSYAAPIVNAILLVIIDEQYVNLRETKAIPQLESCRLREYN